MSPNVLSCISNKPDLCSDVGINMLTQILRSGNVKKIDIVSPNADIIEYEARWDMVQFFQLGEEAT